MGLTSTRDVEIVGPISSTNNALVRFDGTTGALAQDSLVIVDDSGNLTANEFHGDGTNITGIPGGGDVVGPSSATDNAIARYDSTTGKLIQDSSGATIGDNNTITVVVDAGQPGLRVKQSVTLKSTIIDFYEEGATRKGWFGYGSSSERHKVFIANDYSDGDIGLHPSNGDGDGTVDIKGYTALGKDASGLYPAIKIKQMNGTTGNVEGQVVSFTHDLNQASILAITCVCNGSLPNNQLDQGYEYSVRYDSTKIYMAMDPTNSENILSKTFKVMITHDDN